MSCVLVIVVTYNGMQWLPRCLASVANYDVLVVDNNSTDDSAEYVSQHFPKIVLLRNKHNTGFTGGNNLGFMYAFEHGYDYVYLLNQDAWLAPGALEIMLETAVEFPEYAVLSPLQMVDGFLSFDHQFAKIWSLASDNSGACQGSFNRVIEVDRVMAAHWLMPVCALKKVGVFSEIFPYYGQDDDWCNRARYHGWKIGIVPMARAVHDRGNRQESKQRIIDRNYREGAMVRLCDINKPLWERFLFVCVFTFVKAVKYFSYLPFVHFATICKKLPEIRMMRSINKEPYGCFN